MKIDCTRLLAELEDLKRSFGVPPRPLEQKLRALNRCKFTEAAELIRFHEALLFFRAYPPSAKVLRQVDAILKTSGQRASQLPAADSDLSPLDDPAVSGIPAASVPRTVRY